MQAHTNNAILVFNVSNFKQSLRVIFLLNTNGIAKGNPGFATCSTVVKVSEDKWVVACSRRLGYATNFMAKLNGLKDGFILIKNRELLPIVMRQILYLLSKL